ncbi:MULTISPECIES: leucine efflux protein LeuE [Streptomyces]|uniref:leucine efflux protein LeuE n=1 Tax=Streptomyces TaxID=1883 RepID=UPI000F6DACCA|nr:MULTISPECIES: leucine efflux protein LeuE [unclassified Streptomyces]AZM93730.1 leucine efflux protein LeuE [Streptomyces sp. W1SF4]RSS52239.1 leucine efflux protein LeuE [Streptomyces sp. WAC07061]
MLGVQNLLTYALGALLIILLPGPSSLFTLSVAARLGVRAGYRAAAGMFLGETLLMVATAAGLASLLQANELVFAVVKYAGAGYLTWIAVGMIRAAWAMWRRRDDDTAKAATATATGTADATPPPNGRLFRRSLVITVLNPKAILFFLSFFVQFVDPGYAYPGLSFALLAVVYQAISIAYVTVLIFSGTYLASQFRRRRKLSAGLTTGAGALFLGFAAKLATTGN